MAFCDLHIHSTASDGSDPPEALPRLVKDAGLAAFALTDHDTPDGLAACANAAKRLRVRFIPGIELSANPDLTAEPNPQTPPTGTLHLLGYGIDPNHADLHTIRDRLLQARDQRNPQIIANLAKLGVNIDYNQVVARAGGPGSVVGRPHIAQLLVDKCYVKSVHEAFRLYIGEGAAAYVRKDRLSARDAIQAIHDAGGLAVLAHPVQLGLDNEALEHALAGLVDLGLDGIETRHSDHRPADIKRFEAYAQRFDLLTTGGSDYHGSNKAVKLGDAKVPMTDCRALLDALAVRA